MFQPWPSSGSTEKCKETIYISPGIKKARRIKRVDCVKKHEMARDCWWNCSKPEWYQGPDSGWNLGTSWCAMLLLVFVCKSSFPVQSPHFFSNQSGGHFPRCVVQHLTSKLHHYNNFYNQASVKSHALCVWHTQLTPFTCSHAKQDYSHAFLSMPRVFF